MTNPYQDPEHNFKLFVRDEEAGENVYLASVDQKKDLPLLLRTLADAMDGGAKKELTVTKIRNIRYGAFETSFEMSRAGFERVMTHHELAFDVDQIDQNRMPQPGSTIVAECIDGIAHFVERFKLATGFIIDSDNHRYIRFLLEPTKAV